MKTQMVRGDATREALILAALQTFAGKGFGSVSTRELASVSGVNQALIGYHFGGKEGLYLAVFEHIKDRVQQQVGPVAEQIRRVLAQADPATAGERQQVYLPPILGLVDAVLSMMLNPETEHWAQLIVREQARPTAAFDVIYDGFMGVFLGLLTTLVLRLRGDGDELGARLLVVGMLGQLVIWRAARTGVLRHLDWATLDETKIAEVKQAVRRNVRAQLLA